MIKEKKVELIMSKKIYRLKLMKIKEHQVEIGIFL